MGRGLSDAEREVVQRAAIQEFALTGIDGFSIEGVSVRAAVPPNRILQEWGDRRVLLMDSQIWLARREVPDIDTGSLRGDLEALVALLNQLFESNEIRRLFRRLLPADESFDISEVRTDFWRVQDDQQLKIFQRARDRGELREDIDARNATQMFRAAICHDMTFADAPLRPQYASDVIEVFLRGLAP